jgi:hypothetical protein
MDTHINMYSFQSTYFSWNYFVSCSRDSSVGIALGYGLDDRGSRVQFPVGAGKFSIHHRVPNGSGAHPASYPMGTGGSFPGGKADHLSPSSAEVKEWVELYPHSPNTPSWRGAQLKHRNNFTFYLLIRLVLLNVYLYTSSGIPTNNWQPQRLQWLRRVCSWTGRTLRSGVRMPLEAWM